MTALHQTKVKTTKEMKGFTKQRKPKEYRLDKGGKNVIKMYSSQQMHALNNAKGQKISNVYTEI